MTACGGDDGAQGPVGEQGPTGEQGPIGDVVVSDDATSLSLAITSATQTSETGLTVNFNIKDQDGYGYVGLKVARFTVAQLVPVGADGPNEPSRWLSYISKVEAKPDLSLNIGSGTEDKTQANYESCDPNWTGTCDETLTNHGDSTGTMRLISSLIAP